ncbi:AsmA family protein [Marinobacter salinisoli]|uniref:AsmA family protein n=1 Tax=Marinobacter salinisoli TaxID=2769486 RepID=A0ABX7MRH2_9GAMM|nr:AsmA family protein [Marinobacter salinisoli]QSP94956.1 AsmA family protein [Marinobacter salinisoli]
MKVVRYLLIALVALIVLAVVAIAIAMAVIDPNNYKPQIESAVEKHTNLDLVLDGDISWSFIPLGIELNNVEANLEGGRLVALEQLVAQVDFMSLITMSPRVGTFTLSGLDARLEVNEKGEGNWTRIMPEGTSTAETEQPTREQPAEEEPAPAQDGDGEPLAFNVKNIEIANAQVHYTDKRTGQAVTLENFTLNASDIALDSEFPLDVSFRVETAKPQFELDGNISTRIEANEALNEFAVSGLKAVFDMAGEPLGGKSVTAELAGSASANLAQETANLSDFTLALADVSVTTDLDVKGFGDKPSIKGTLALNEFSPKDLLAKLGQAPIETRDPDVLDAVAFSTSIGGSEGNIELSDIKLRLDDTTFAGSGSYNLSNSATTLNLTGDKLNVDRYLAPEAEETEGAKSKQASSEQKSGSNAAGPANETDLLPLEALRALLLDINLGLGELIASNLTITDIKTSTTAKGGLLKVDEFSGKLYDGSFGANVSLDARKDAPDWKINANASNVQTLPLLTDLAEVDMLAGGANLKVNVTTKGNRMSALKNNAGGQIGFNLAEGEFRKMNLTRLACQGIALANQESLGTSGWGTTTPFNDMRGTLKIDGNTLENTDLVASLAGMKLEGDGTVNLEQTSLDYEAGLRIVGEIHRDEACRVTDVVQNVVIPVECRGNFAEEPAKLCSFDGSRFRDTLKDIAANAARAKAEEEIDRATEKAEKKIQEKLEEELGDKLKGLFK